MKILTVFGARPQFIKAAMVSREIHRRTKTGEGSLAEVIVHTGQHFDDNMSKIFFEQLEIPRPNYNLEISSLPHGAMTGRMLEGIESILMAERPQWVLVYGDTNSTLAGALAAAKLHIPVAHVEAGLRSFNMRMPEEINRIVADRLSSILLCPTEQAVTNLRSEGLTRGAYLVGDVMYDAILHYRDSAQTKFSLERWQVTNGSYALCTVHRAENTDDSARLNGILAALTEIAREIPVLFPVHPRTRKLIESRGGFGAVTGLRLIEPLSYLEMILLESKARAILTDSGGVQKEAFFNAVPCITLRDETEWVETVDLGWNILCGAAPNRILEAWNSLAARPRRPGSPYGNGQAAASIVEHLCSSAPGL